MTSMRAVMAITKLLSNDGIPFTAGTMHEIPDESGVYLFVQKGTNDFLYVGQSGVGLRSRMKDHWGGAASSDLAQKIADKGWTKDHRQSARDWIKRNVLIQYITSDEFDMDIVALERYAINYLKPRLNG